MKLSPVCLLTLIAIATPILAAKSPVGVLSVGAQPESVIRGFEGDLFVTLMGENRKPGDGDGAIVRVRGRDVTPFVEGFDDPKGLGFTGEYLITADFTTVWKIDREGNRSVLAEAADFPDQVFLNDVAIEPGGNAVLVTDMGAVDRMKGPDGKLWPLDSPEGKSIPALGRVFRITLDGEVTIAIDRGEPLRIPNGVDVLDDGTIRVGEFFSGDLLEWKDGEWSIIGGGHRGIDAVVHDAKGTIFLSEVYSGDVYRMAGPGSEPVLIAALNSAADHCLDDETGGLIIPDTKAGVLVFLPLD